jgi:outer membrane protein assembly factor BamA
MSHSDPLWGATYRFTQLGVETLWYKSIPGRGNIAARLGVDVGNADQIQHQYYMGGLSEVRGYADSRFRGQNAWVGNLEYRVAPYVSNWFVLQTLGFVDGGGVADTPTDLPRTLSAASAGLGIRLISPKIYRLVMRFDYAFPLINDDGTSGFSFGAQQFF